MSYESTAALAADQTYLDRLGFCVLGEAVAKPSDPFVDQIMTNGPAYAASVFGSLVATAPGFGDKYEQGGQALITDGDLLSAVQASWVRVAELHTPNSSGGTPV